MMNRDVIIFDGMELNKFHPIAKKVYQGYTRTIEVVYTIGKSKEWGRAQKDSIRGLTTHGSFRKKTKHLYGRFLIDVKACSADRVMSLRLDGSGGKPKSSSVNFHQLKKSVLQTFVHESFHVVQAWQSGGIKYLYKKKASHSRKVDDKREGATYLSDPVEQAAFEREKIVKSDMIEQLYDGKFDKLISLKILNQVVENSRK